MIGQEERADLSPSPGSEHDTGPGQQGDASGSDIVIAGCPSDPQPLPDETSTESARGDPPQTMSIDAVEQAGPIQSSSRSSSDQVQVFVGAVEQLSKETSQSHMIMKSDNIGQSDLV